MLSNFNQNALKGVSQLHITGLQIPLTCRARGPCCKLQSDFSPLIIAHGPEIDGEKQGSVTYSTDRDDEVSKIFIISLDYCVPSGFGNDFLLRKTASHF